MTTNVVITMAGFGRRFLDAGYSVPKYQIEAHGKSLFWWSMVGLRHLFDEARFVFVVRASDGAGEFIRKECCELGIGEHRVAELGEPTDGQATTAILALDFCGPNWPLSIFNIDTHIRPGALENPPPGCDGWIPCFDAPGDHWSFVRLAPTGAAVEVREKNRISRHATIGYYWFRTPVLYRRLYESYYRTGVNRKERGEAYVAPLYNQLIAEGGSVRISEIDVASVIPLGTPVELAAFIRGARPIC